MKEVKKHHVVTISNELLSKPMNYSLSERRLLAMVLSQIKPTYNKLPSADLKATLTVEQLKEFYWKQQVGDILTSKDTLTITVSNYAELFGLSKGNARVELQDAVLKFSSRVMEVETEEYIGRFHWVSCVVFDKVTGTVSLKFTEEVLPYLQCLKSHFTSIRLDKVIGLHSTYSWRLYELYRMRLGENSYVVPYFSLEELYESMGVPASRREYKVFKQRILVPTLGELKEKGVATLVVKERKVGRKVVGLEFKKEEML